MKKKSGAIWRTYPYHIKWNDKIVEDMNSRKLNNSSLLVEIKREAMNTESNSKLSSTNSVNGLAKNKRYISMRKKNLKMIYFSLMFQQSRVMLHKKKQFIYNNSFFF